MYTSLESALGAIGVPRTGANLPAGTAATLVKSLGQMVRTLPATAATSVDVAGLAAGVYTLRLTLAGHPVTKRVVVE